MEWERSEATGNHNKPLGAHQQFRPYELEQHVCCQSLTRARGQTRKWPLEQYGCRKQIGPPRSTLTSSLSGEMSNFGIRCRASTR